MTALTFYRPNHFSVVRYVLVKERTSIYININALNYKLDKEHEGISEVQTQPGFTTNIGSAMFHLRGLRFIWYFSVSQRLLYQSRRPHFFSLYAFSSQTTQYGFTEIHGYLCAWLNLTGGELDPHATLARMPYVLCGERVLG